MRSCARASLARQRAARREAAIPRSRISQHEIAAAPDLERVVYLSSVGVYGDRGGAWVDEASPPSPGSPRARGGSPPKANGAALGAARGVPVDILRLAGIYGPGRNALVKLRAAKRGASSSRARSSTASMSTMSPRSLCASSRPAGRARSGTSPTKSPRRRKTSSPSPPSLLGMAPPPEEAFETASLSPMARSFYDDNRRVSVEKLRRKLGYRWLYPTYREGLRALAAAGEGRESENRA